MPSVCTVYAMIMRYVEKHLKLDPTDFATSYWGLMSLIFQIIAVYNYCQPEFVFDWYLWTMGFFGSVLNLGGCAFVVAAFCSGSPIGPIGALVSSQTILVTILDSLFNWRLPNWIQIIALCLGLLGTFMLSIPDQISALFRMIFCCKIPGLDTKKKTN